METQESCRSATLAVLVLMMRQDSADAVQRCLQVTLLVVIMQDVEFRGLNRNRERFLGRK